MIFVKTNKLRSIRLKIICIEVSWYFRYFLGQDRTGHEHKMWNFQQFVQNSFQSICWNVCKAFYYIFMSQKTLESEAVANSFFKKLYHIPRSVQGWEVVELFMAQDNLNVTNIMKIENRFHFIIFFIWSYTLFSYHYLHLFQDSGQKELNCGKLQTWEKSLVWRKWIYFLNFFRHSRITKLPTTHRQK